LTQNNVAPIAVDGLKQFAALYRIEAQARGTSAQERMAIRQQKSAPKIAAFKACLDQARSQASTKSPTGDTLKYIPKTGMG
jgi:transposase